ncbi:MAG: tRNA pseudouridine55 synthase [Solirubrobacteraceae bacterium]|nr:tRNA pseudouridine55 synthase [Solirubrobacteraceae bacterium]
MSDDGILLVDKEAGVTSHDVVARERRRTGLKTGHAGTLDPFATGLLLILLGRATRIQRYVMDLPKSYITTAHLGWKSTTGDRDGEISRGEEPHALSLQIGTQLHEPPAFSARKVGGRRAYKLARAGEAVELEAREVTVYRADLLSHDGDRATFAIECSAGTYIRSLIMGLNDAYCETLRRTAIGPFNVEDAGTFVPLNDALNFIPSVMLFGDHARQAAHGVAVPGTAEAVVRLIDADGLVALAEPRPDGTLKPIVGFRG